MVIYELKAEYNQHLLINVNLRTMVYLYQFDKHDQAIESDLSLRSVDLELSHSKDHNEEQGEEEHQPLAQGLEKYPILEKQVNFCHY